MGWFAVRILALLSLLSVGCGSNASVSLVAQIESPELEVGRVALGTVLEGGFALRLVLGEYAEESATVSLGSFSITAEDEEIVNGLELEADVGSAMPLTLGPGRSATVPLKLAGKETHDASIADELCSKRLTFRGTLSSNGKPRSLESEEFEATCP